MKQKHLIKFIFSSIILIGISVFSLTAQNTKEESTPEASYILDINAKYMREYIFDYIKNKSKFVYKGKTPAIIDFYASWCAPCRKLSPILKKIVKEYNGKIKLYKVDIDSERDLAIQFDVQSIPLLIYISADGKPHQTLGFLSEKELRKEIKKIIK